MASTTSPTKSKEQLVILFVGSNPSNASTCDIAFHASTKSSKVLTGWSMELQGVKMHINVLNKKTEGNRPLKKSEITSNLEQLAENLRCIAPDRVIALGKTAATALTLLHVEHYEMPHPSGRNRLLNNQEYMSGKVKGLIEFCSSKSPSKI